MDWILGHRIPETVEDRTKVVINTESLIGYALSVGIEISQPFLNTLGGMTGGWLLREGG